MKYTLKITTVILIKGLGMIHLNFYILILFYRVLSELSEIFNDLRNFKVIFEIYTIKIGDLNKLLMEGANQKGEKNHFTKNLFPLSFFKQSYSNFHRKSII